MPNQPSVAVITATIGRDELIKAIQSVQAQTYPCTHYVFVDGKDYHKKVKNLLKKNYPNVVVTYLPMNTGANQMYNSYINAIAPFLVKEDILCFLDDDNWYDKDHVKHMAHYISHYQADYAYSLRYFVGFKTDIVWEDNTESLGFWHFPSPITSEAQFTIRNQTHSFAFKITHHEQNLIDISCLAVTRSVATPLALSWIQAGFGNDRHITKVLFDRGLKGICTGKRTLYYRTNENTHQLDFDALVKDKIIDQATADNLNSYEKWSILHQIHTSINQFIKTQSSPNSTPVSWEIPTIMHNQKLIVVNE